MRFKILIAPIFTVILFLSFYIYKWEFRKPVFEIYFFSLNRGRAIFIRSPDGKTALIGGGQSSEVMQELTKVMPFYRKKIDYVFVPGATPAQIGGLLEIFDRYEIGETIMPKIMATSSVLTQVLKSIEKKKIHSEKVKRGDVIRVGDLEIKVLFPYEDFNFNKSNLPELALEIDYKNTGLFLLGNLSKTVEKDILKNIDIKTSENLLEFYNSNTHTRNFGDLIEQIKPKFIFTTKEKSAQYQSDGSLWGR